MFVSVEAISVCRSAVKLDPGWIINPNDLGDCTPGYLQDKLYLPQLYFKDPLQPKKCFSNVCMPPKAFLIRAKFVAEGVFSYPSTEHGDFQGISQESKFQMYSRKPRFGTSQIQKPPAGKETCNLQCRVNFTIQRVTVCISTTINTVPLPVTS